MKPHITHDRVLSVYRVWNDEDAFVEVPAFTVRELSEYWTAVLIWAGDHQAQVRRVKERALTLQRQRAPYQLTSVRADTMNGGL